VWGRSYRDLDLYVKPASGLGAEDLLLAGPQMEAAESWSPDDRFLATRLMAGDSKRGERQVRGRSRSPTVHDSAQSRRGCCLRCVRRRRAVSGERVPRRPRAAVDAPRQLDGRSEK